MQIKLRSISFKGMGFLFEQIPEMLNTVDQEMREKEEGFKEGF